MPFLRKDDHPRATARPSVCILPPLFWRQVNSSLAFTHKGQLRRRPEAAGIDTIANNRVTPAAGMPWSATICWRAVSMKSCSAAVHFLGVDRHRHGGGGWSDAHTIPYQSKPYQTTERCPYPALSRTPSLDTRQLSPADSLRQPVPLNHSTKHGWEHQDALRHTHTHTHRHKDTYTIHKQPVPVTKHVWEHGGEIWTGCRKHLAFFDHQSSHQSQSSRQRIHFSSENQRLSEISKMRRMESRAVVKC